MRMPRACALSLILCGTVCSAGAGVDGRVTVADQTFNLCHVSALLHENEERLLPGSELRIVFSDRPVATEDLGSPTLEGFVHNAEAVGASGLVFCMEPHSPVLELEVRLFGIASSLSKESHRLDHACVGNARLEVMPDRVQGRLHRVELGDRARADGHIIVVEADFSTSILRNSRYLGELRGQEARGSAQAQAVLNYERALWDGRWDNAKDHCTSVRAAEVDNFTGRHGHRARERMRHRLGDPDTRALAIDAVFVRETRAVVLFRDDHGATMADVVFDGHSWKVG